MDKIGRIAFVVGLLIAIVAGIGFDQPWMSWVLAVLGAVVGFMNIGGGERTSFMIAGIALTMSATAFSQVPFIGDKLSLVVGNVMIFVAGAVFVVAILSLFGTAKD
jgi:hypothetical protein